MSQTGLCSGAIALGLASLATGRKVKPGVGVYGEIDPRDGILTCVWKWATIGSNEIKACQEIGIQTLVVGKGTVIELNQQEREEIKVIDLGTPVQESNQTPKLEILKIHTMEDILNDQYLLA